ncbi:MAG: flagellar biosynthesis protein FlgN [Spirochaetaceae bacterium]|nr:flagellar biosynthesis protein FlgN [Spirochaetaceae bacterium]
MTAAIEEVKIKDPWGNEGASKALSSAELEHRVAILKRFRELLSQQRDRFRQYLDVLDRQKDIIKTGNADDLTAHVELEEKIVGDIFAIQKVIDPLEDMYRTIFPPVRTVEGAHPEALPREIQEVPTLKAALEELKTEAVLRSSRNRQLLAKRLEELRAEMKTLRANPYAIHRSAYSGETASLVDIKG